MDFDHYTDESARAAADLVNTVGSITGNDYMPTPEDLIAFLVEHDIEPPTKVTPRDMAEVGKVRARLKEVFFAPDEEAAARVINELLAYAEAQPYMTDHNGVWHLHYHPTDAPVAQRLAGITAMGLATLICRYGRDRLGICAADRCDDVYVDTSRNRSRRFCNDKCSTRTAVAAHRARSSN